MLSLLRYESILSIELIEFLSTYFTSFLLKVNYLKLGSPLTGNLL